MQTLVVSSLAKTTDELYLRKIFQNYGMIEDILVSGPGCGVFENGVGVGGRKGSKELWLGLVALLLGRGGKDWKVVRTRKCEFGIVVVENILEECGY